MIIESNRLYLRLLEHSDAKDLHEILGNAENMPFYPAPYTLEDTLNWIERSRKSYTENDFGLWAVILKENNSFIGQCGISYQDIDGESLPEIGYQFHLNYWHNGYATEAAMACLEYGFDSLGLSEIFIHTYYKNSASQKVAERLGMERIKRYPKFIAKYNISWDHIVYSMKQ